LLFNYFQQYSVVARSAEVEKHNHKERGTKSTLFLLTRNGLSKLCKF